MSPTAKTTGCRFSIATAATRRSGTIYTGPAASIWKAASRGCCYIGELGPHQPVNRNFPNLGPRLSILSRDGKLLSRVDEKSGLSPTQFSAPHGLAVDRRGDVYIGEVSWTAWQNYTNPGQPVPPTLAQPAKARVPQ